MQLPPSNIRDLKVRNPSFTDYSLRPWAKHYFVVMIDYGRRGLESIVDPEITRREMISRIVSGEYREIAWIHEVREYGDGQPIITTDITAEVINEVEQLQMQAAE